MNKNKYVFCLKNVWILWIIFISLLIKVCVFNEYLKEKKLNKCDKYEF